MEETHLPQKTLHNFRVRLIQHDCARLVFEETAEGSSRRALRRRGVWVRPQRLRSLAPERTDLVKVNIDGWQWAEATEEWRKPYTIRAEI